MSYTITTFPIFSQMSKFGIERPFKFCLWRFLRKIKKIPGKIWTLLTTRVVNKDKKSKNHLSYRNLWKFSLLVLKNICWCSALNIFQNYEWWSANSRKTFWCIFFFFFFWHLFVFLGTFKCKCKNSNDLHIMLLWQR